MRALPSRADRHPSPRPLLLATLAWAAGILADRQVFPGASPNLLHWWLTAAVLLLSTAVFVRLGRLWASAGTLLLAIACVGGGWHHLYWNYVANNQIARFALEHSQPVCVEAVAVDRTKSSPAPAVDPLRAVQVGPTSELLVRVTRLRDGHQWRNVSGRCRLRVAGELDRITTGDRLLVFALCERTSPAVNPGQYDWATVERGAGRYCELFCRAPECVTVLEAATAGVASRWIDRLRQRCEWRLLQYVGEENGDLALAILLGARERLEKSTTEAFLKTGTVHLLVVSGLHVGIFALVVGWIVCSGIFSRRWGILLTALLVIAYAAIAGGRPPVVRAAVLVLFALLAMVQGRRTSIINLLAAAAWVVLIYNPSELFRGGTQLSFLCVAALIGFGELVRRQPPRDPLQQLIHDASSWRRKSLHWCAKKTGKLALASLVIWIVAAPLVAYHFHISTPIGIAMTPLIWPLIAGALASGLAICTCAWLLPPVASLLGLLCSWCLGTTETIVELATRSGAGSLYCAGPPLWWLWVFYAGLGLINLVPRLRLAWQWQLSCAALWITCGLAIAASRNPGDGLRCTFLAMGHGTCVVLELPGRQTLLYDAGSLSSPVGASKTVAGYLWSRGITRIDAIILSHADIDHYDAIPGLLDRFEIGAVYVSPQMFGPAKTEGPLTAPDYLRGRLQEAAVPLYQLWQNDRLRVTDPGVAIEILHPPRAGVGGSDNANSILLSVRYQGHSILLPGDLESPGLEAVISQHPRNVDILMAPHHGSSHSDPHSFASWCSPRWTVVSGRNHGQDFELTETAYQNVGAQILHTGKCGATHFTLYGQTIELATFRQTPSNKPVP
ncbi:MAG: ComEC/Rec2 family competence protein [Pirellulales bacterium]|nr:ComEC/Rec2 family competence protein [Pirellulales bacterium]